MKRLVLAAALIASVVTLAAQTPIFSPTFQKAGATAQTSRPYFPGRFDWAHKKPEEAGMNGTVLNEAVKMAIAAETTGPKDMVQFLSNSFAREPFFGLIGPVKDRGPASGIITRNGYIVAEWGEPHRADITNSVTKTFLTTVVGLTWQKGLIRDVNDYARDYMPPDIDLFESEHNRKIKWDHLLRQTSDWQGTLWDRPDWADRPTPANGTIEQQMNVARSEPGTKFEYNDVRVNVLALAALQVLRRPLPDVLREEVMEPIGASSTWRWYGYENSWVDIDGKRVQSVSGGGHWGGGMFIDSYDMARFGYLFLRNGKWKDKQIVSEKWMFMARTPGPDNKNYGYANWYLNHTGNSGEKPLPNAPENSVRFVGNGSNIIYIDWENDIVASFRWIRGDRDLNNVIAKVIESIKSKPTTSSAAGR